MAQTLRAFLIMKLTCPRCVKEEKVSSGLRTLRRFGSFYRKSDGKWIQRFSCLKCKKTFSRATFLPQYRQKKRHKNEIIRRLYSGGISQREAARVLNLNRKTIVRKFLFLANQAEKELHEWNQHLAPATEVEFDDLETFEHTKCKPLSVTLMVQAKTRRILGFEVSQMPAKGRLAVISRKKYGPRADQRAEGRRRLFERLKPFVDERAIIRSDSNPHYPADVKLHFPQALHQTVLGGRGAITGQGELKKLRFDPIFSLNHTCAMKRANMNRLFRRTWCTTKKLERLRAHLLIYAMSHNRRLSTA